MITWEGGLNLCIRGAAQDSHGSVPEGTWSDGFVGNLYSKISFNPVASFTELPASLQIPKSGTWALGPSGNQGHMTQVVKLFISEIEGNKVRNIMLDLGR